MVVGDANYCTEKKKFLSERAAKATNKCRSFDFNPIDAFGENKNNYKPRESKKHNSEQCDGQMSLFGKE